MIDIKQIRDYKGRTNKVLEHYHALQKNNIVDIRDYHKKSFK